MVCLAVRISASHLRSSFLKGSLYQVWRLENSYHKVSGASKYTKYYRVLDLPDNSDRETVRRKYIELVKLHHPDANKDPSDKFSEIDTAYRSLQIKFKEDKLREEASVGEYGLYYQEKSHEEEEDEEEWEHPDIKHTAPQHRQYLENAGFGYGTPSQRQKQHQKYRAFRANEAVFEHRMGRLTAQYEDRIATRERKTVKKHSTRNQIERLVEDLITESMASGEFDNLAGKGKPLPNRVDYNPYSDFTTHKMNQILVEGGFAPEWVMLRKEIREEFEDLRREMKIRRQELGPPPLPASKLDQWNLFCRKLEDDCVRKVNKKVEKFNLIVPMLNAQIFPFNLKAESKKILEHGYDPNAAAPVTPTKPVNSGKPEKGLFQEIFERIFKS